MRKRFYLVIIAFLLILCSPSTSVNAESLDGKAKDVPFGDLGIESTVDASYYDWFCPFSISFEDIGGYATDCKYQSGCAYVGAFSYLDSSSASEKRFDSAYNREFDKGGSSYWGYTIQTESDTGLNYIEKDGVKFYIAAIPKGVYNYSGGSFTFGNGTFMDNGFVFDVVIADGTVIHFIAGDGIGVYHSNCDEGDVDSGWQDKLQLQFCKLKLPQYKNTFHACKPNQLLELWGNSNVTTGFPKKYNISKDNPIVGLRLYDMSAKAGIKVKSGVSGFDHNSKISVSSSVDSNGNVTSSNAGFISGTFSESDYASWNLLCEEDLSYLLDDATKDNLNNNELVSLDDWKRQTEDEAWYITWGRRIVMMVGIILVVWSLLFYCGFWFDRINTFIDLDLVGILTLRKLKVSPDDTECTFKLSDIAKTDTRTVNHKYCMIISVSALALGVFMISGIMFTLIRKFVNLIVGFFTR